jgi:hypothetical protein
MQKNGPTLILVLGPGDGSKGDEPALINCQIYLTTTYKIKTPKHKFLYQEEERATGG